MQARESVLPAQRDVYKVSAWKWGIDANSPRWRQLFFKWIFLRFIAFSYKLGIPTPKEVEEWTDEQGRTHRVFRWFEDKGFFESAEDADADCLDVHTGYTRFPLGCPMPVGSGQYGETVYPRKKDPIHHQQTVKFPLVIKDRAVEEFRRQTLANELAKLNQVLDRR